MASFRVNYELFEVISVWARTNKALVRRLGCTVLETIYISNLDGPITEIIQTLKMKIFYMFAELVDVNPPFSSSLYNL